MRQEWKRRWAQERKVKGTGMGRVVRWNRKVRQLRPLSHQPSSLATRADSDISGRYAEIGKHVALVCIHGEDIGRRWGTWEQMNEPERWRKRVKDPGGEYEVDLVETFFTHLDLH